MEDPGVWDRPLRGRVGEWTLIVPGGPGMVPALPIPVPVKVRLAAEISIDIMEEEEYPARQ